MPGMSRGFHLWHSQPLNRVALPWLANSRPPAMSPHANGTRHLSHWFNSGRIKGGRDGGKRMIQRLNEENGRQENTLLSTWRWFKEGWPRPRSLLLTALNIYLTSFNHLLSRGASKVTKNGFFKPQAHNLHNKQSISKRAFNIDWNVYILSVAMTKPHKKSHSDLTITVSKNNSL